MNDLSTLFIQFCFAVFILFWIVTAFSAKRTLVGPARWQHWRLGALAAAVIAWIAFRHQLARHVGFALWPHTATIGLIADGVTLLGLALLLWARVALGGNWSAAVVIKENHEIIERGPYAFVRHPIYVGVMLMILGIVINDGRLAWLLFFLVCLVGLSIKARREEQLLTSHFPAAYRAYRSRVKAVIPFVL